MAPPRFAGDDHRFQNRLQPTGSMPLPTMTTCPASTAPRTERWQSLSRRKVCGVEAEGGGAVSPDAVLDHQGFPATQQQFPLAAAGPVYLEPQAGAALAVDVRRGRVPERENRCKC